MPIIVGGTGLYFKALLEGLSPIPPIDPDVRARWRQRPSEVARAELHALLAARDPVMAARLMPTDPQRIVRALEVLDSTGRSLADWQRQPGPAGARGRRRFGCWCCPSAQTLPRGIDARFDAMLAAGALDEVRGLLRSASSPELPVMRALGVAPLASAPRRRRSRRRRRQRAKAETRQYAKRQLTWLRRNMISWKSDLDARNGKIDMSEILAFIES